MPSEFGPEDQATSDLRILPSPVMDFQFGLFLLTKHCFDPEKWVPPWVVDVSQANPELVGRLMEFWAEPGLADVDGGPYREWGELLVAAWHTGTMFGSTVDQFLDATEEALARGFTVPVMESEPESVQALIQRRVDWLGRNPEGRTTLMSLVRGIRLLVLPHWEKFGREAAEAAAKDLAGRLRPGADLRSLLPGNNFVHKEAFQPLITAARARGELVLIPLGLAGGGQFLWSFPGLTVVGAGVDSAEREARKRERSERAANRLKVLSDPTRVAILHELLKGRQHNPATVTELASQFGLSQPTVSVHVKILREAGLVTAERDGNQVFYHAEEETISRYVQDSLDDLLQRAERADGRELVTT